jgi:hypothetical protein
MSDAATAGLPSATKSASDAMIVAGCGRRNRDDMGPPGVGVDGRATLLRGSTGGQSAL